MSWLEPRAVARTVRLALALAAAGLLAGCFQPLYGDPSITGAAGSVRDKLSSVEIFPIAAPNGTSEARVAVELRNDLIFGTTGGSGANSPTHQLKVLLRPRRQQVIVDVNTARADVEQYGIDASYSLVDLATGKVVAKGEAFARVSYDIPGQEQRFARDRGLRDAENRAAKVISESITSRLASFFIAGT